MRKLINAVWHWMQREDSKQARMAEAADEERRADNHMDGGFGQSPGGM